MYTKEQLEKLPIPELMAIASELGVKVSQNDELENVVYAILDKAAEQVAAGEPVSKRKRTRIAKDNSKVYTVNGSESTTLDKKATKAGKKPTLDALIAEQAAAEKAETEQPEQTAAEQAEEKPAPKKRVRKTKKEQEEEAVAEASAEAKPEKKTRKKAAKKDEADLFANEPIVEAIPEAVAEAIPEAVVEDDNEELSPEMIDQLQEKMAANVEAEEAPVEGDADDVWDGDPGDGTDFITIIDLPIEDQSAIPTVDIFDRPVAQQPQDEPMMQDYRQTAQPAAFDFGELITGNGVLEIIQDGYGFLRSSDFNY